MGIIGGYSITFPMFRCVFVCAVYLFGWVLGIIIYIQYISVPGLFLHGRMDGWMNS